MAKIPWWVWMGVGIAMFFISNRIGEGLAFFMYVSLGFIGIGIFKIIVTIIIGDKEKTAKTSVQQIKSQQYTCPRCMNIVASNFRFCPHCGTRIR